MTGSSNVFIGGGTAQTAKIVPEIPQWAYTVSDLTMFAAGLISFGGAAAKGPGALQTLFNKIPGVAKIRKIACRLGALAVLRLSRVSDEPGGSHGRSEIPER